MVDRAVLSTRLSALEGYLTELEEFRRFSREEFVRQPGLHHLAERFLHLASECVIDIANHVVSDQGFRQPEGYKDAIEVLSEEGLLEEGLAQRLQGWMGFRNVLVHLYMKIDHGRSYDAIVQDLGDLRDFAAAMARLLHP